MSRPEVGTRGFRGDVDARAIRAVGAVRVRVPLRRPVATGSGGWTACDAWLLRLVDGAGRAGLGEATLGPGARAADQARLDGLVRSLVGGPDALAEWVDAGRTTSHEVAPGEPAMAAIRSGIGAALVDLGVLLADRPRAASIRLNATLGAAPVTATVAAARAAADAGFTTLKLKGGDEASTAALVERLAAVRSAVGPAIAMRLDVNGSWDVISARERLAALVPVGLAYVEQPLAPGPGIATEMAALRRLGVPLAADESVTSEDAACWLIDAGAVDVLVVKPARVGGPAAALAIADRATRSGTGVVVATLVETGVGLAAGVVTAAMLPGSVAGSSAHGLATAGVLTSDLVLGGGEIRAGRMTVPAGPGLGITLDEEAVARHAVELLGAWP